MVPAGVEHWPVVDAEAEIPLFEPTGAPNTGHVEDERTSEVEPLDALDT